MIVNKTNQEEVKKLSYQTPVFALFYSHYCGHCKRVYPTWTEMMNFYENDTEIITAETDCVDHPKTCNYFMKISGYPTFAYIINGVATEVMITRTLEKFKEFVNSLKKIDPKSSCQMWFSISEISDYPIFIYSSPSNFSDACEEASHFTNDENKNIIYVDSHFDAIHSNLTSAQEIAAVKRNVQLQVRYDHNRRSVLYDEGDPKFEKVERYQYISQMIEEQKIVPLSDYDEDIVRNSNRRLAILLYMEKRHINSFKDLVFLNSKDILFLKMNISLFHSKFPNVPIDEQAAPALIISNKDKTNFMIMKNQVTNELVKSETLTKITNGQFESQMTFSMKDYLNFDSSAKNERIVIPQESSSGTIQISLIIFMIFILIALLYIVFSLFERLCRTRKIKKRNYYLDRAYKGGFHGFLQLFDCSKKDVFL